MKIMIVDDEPFIRRGIVTMLEKHSPTFQIAGEAEDGSQGYEQAMALRPDVVMTDIRMPETDGIEMIRRIRESLPHTRFIILTGFEDLEYYKKALAYRVSYYILKPVLSESLIEVLEAVRKEIAASHSEAEGMRLYRENAMRKLLFDEPDDAEHASGPSLTEFPAEAGWYRIASWLGRSSSTREIAPIVSSMVTELPHAEMYAQIVHNGRLYMVIKGRAPFELEWDRLERRLNGSPEYGYLAFSAWKRSSAFLREAVQETQQAMRFRFRSRNRLLLFPRLNPIAAGRGGHTFQQLLSDLERAFDISPSDQILEQLHSLRSKLCEADTPYVYEDMEYMFRFIWNKIWSRYQHGLNAEEIFRKFPMTLFSAEHVCDLAAYFDEVEHLILLLDGGRKDGTLIVRKEVKQMLDVMRKRMSEPLKLSDIAESVFMNPVYASQLFKKETGLNMTEYLTELRLTQAKWLLAKTSNRISEIAEAVGYENPKYFSSLFRQKTDVTPQEYRETFQIKAIPKSEGP